MSKRLIAIATAAALGAGFATAAQARGIYDVRAEVQPVQTITPFAGWDRAELLNAFSAENLLGMDVRSARGESIGEITNMIVTRDGHVRAIVFAGGGVLGVGETFYRVPWERVEFNVPLGYVRVPMTEDQVARFEWGAEEVHTTRNTLPISEVLGESVALRDGVRYGEVEDVVIGRNGAVKALIVESDWYGAPGLYGFPFRGEIAFNAAADMYTLPYTLAEVRGLEPFDYRAYNIYGPEAIGATADVAGGAGYFAEDRRPFFRDRIVDR